MIVILAHLAQVVSSLPANASALENSIPALESAISALESAIKGLENPSVPWEYLALAFTFLVAVGVALELWIIRHEYRDDMEAWALAHFDVLRSPGRPSAKKLTVELISVLLIAIGVMGELGVGVEIASLASQLRAKNAELRSKSDLLVALLSQQTARLERANLELKALIQLRDLSVDQQKAIATELQKFSGRRVVIWVYTEPEAMRLGQVIKDALKGAGISSDLVPRTDTSEFPILGVAVSGDDKAFVKALQSSLLTKDRLERSQESALRTSSNVLIGGMNTSLVIPKGVVIAAYVLVGLKPLPQLKAYEAYVRGRTISAERTISDEQVKVIRTLVGSSLSGHTLTIQANPNDSEIWKFANRIVFSFGIQATAAVWPQGWIVPDGLTFSIGKNRQEDFDLMVKALDAAGVDHAARLKKQSDHKGVADNDLILTVGPRQ